jgi:trans-2,3-dihydro-3-hydroxyanthranilate isomerase
LTPPGAGDILGPVAREHAFVQVDVFTERPLAGNALAVVLDGRGLANAEMQAIAREMNLAETTFVLPATRPECAAHVRIFTPGRELPFAGHPTLGTAWVLASHGLVPRGTRRFALEEGIGPVPVELEGDPSQPGFVWMRQHDAVFGPEIHDRAGIARTLGVVVDDLRPGVPVHTASTGNTFLFVPLRDRAAVDRAALDPRGLPEVAAALGVFIFAIDGADGRRLYSRMFAPHSGVPEDPATGSAGGPLGAYLVRHGLVRGSGELSLVSEQGTKMGRQGFVHIRLQARGTEATDLRVGGGVVPVLEGRLRLP